MADNLVWHKTNRQQHRNHVVSPFEWLLFLRGVIKNSNNTREQLIGSRDQQPIMGNDKLGIVIIPQTVCRAALVHSMLRNYPETEELSNKSHQSPTLHITPGICSDTGPVI